MKITEVKTYTVGQNATPLHVAARCNQVDVIRALVEVRADVNVRGWFDESTPLHTACWFNRPDAARVLIEAGADVEAISGERHKNTPVGWAIIAGADQAVKVLIENGANIGNRYLADARKGVAGEYESHRRAPAERRETIMTLIEAALNQA